jgi:hypothetical protein
MRGKRPAPHNGSNGLRQLTDPARAPFAKNMASAFRERLWHYRAVNR